MSLDSDTIVDRRRIRRKLTFWRVAAVLVAIIAILVAAMRFGPALPGVAGTGGYVARVKIQGLIRNDDDRVESLDRLARSTNAKAVIVHVDSPGGTTAGSEQLHDALRRVASKKPLVVVVDGLAASGGYIAAMASEQIIAQSSSLVGSIGVLFQYPNFTDLLDKVGVKVESVKSSPLKASPSGFEPTSDAARAALASLVNDSFTWFKGLVKQRRGMTDEELAVVSDGRVFTGRQGLPLKLIDQIGTEADAISWLETSRNVPKGLPVRDYTPSRSRGPFGLFTLAAATAEAGGWPAAGGFLRRLALVSEAPRLDGLVSLWQGAGGE